MHAITLMQESPLCSFEVHNEATGVIPKPPDVFLMSVPIVIIVKLLGVALLAVTIMLLS